LTAGEPDFVQALLGGPAWDEEMLGAVEQRAGDLPRDVDL
jgi:hypothetical protein